VMPGSTPQDILSSALFAAAFTYVGGQGLPKHAAILSHMVIGCAQGMSSGGECGPSAMAAGFGKWVSLEMPHGIDPVLGGVLTTLSGGTASVIGGGKFSNGAMQAAFGYLFNALSNDVGAAGERMLGSDLDKNYGNNPRFALSTGQVRMIVNVESNVDGKLLKTSVEIHPDRVLIDKVNSTVHLIECKTGMCAKYTPNQRVALGGTITRILFLGDVGSLKLAGSFNNEPTVRLRIGQGAVFADPGSRVWNSRLTQSASEQGAIRAFDRRLGAGRGAIAAP
jgi:hypothetical protein